MKRYLLDTNHLSGYLEHLSPAKQMIDAALRAGDRVGLCLPVLCEYRAGIRLWPLDEGTAAEFAEIVQETRAKGRVLSQFDLLFAALARQRGLILLTADRDFNTVDGLNVENWL